MYNKLDLMLVVLLLTNAVVLIWLIRNMIVTKNKPAEDPPPSSHSRWRKRLPGKKCPDCAKVIDVRRTVCQHCGHKFKVKPGTEPHPDEVKAGIREPEPEPSDKE